VNADKDQTPVIQKEQVKQGDAGTPSPCAKWDDGKNNFLEPKSGNAHRFLYVDI